MAAYCKFKTNGYNTMTYSADGWNKKFVANNGKRNEEVQWDEHV